MSKLAAATSTSIAEATSYLTRSRSSSDAAARALDTAARSGSNANTLAARSAMPSVSRPSPQPTSMTRAPVKSCSRRSAARWAPSGSSTRVTSRHQPVDRTVTNSDCNPRSARSRHRVSKTYLFMAASLDPTTSGTQPHRKMKRKPDGTFCNAPTCCRQIARGPLPSEAWRGSPVRLRSLRHVQANRSSTSLRYQGSLGWPCCCLT